MNEIFWYSYINTYNLTDGIGSNLQESDRDVWIKKYGAIKVSVGEIDGWEGEVIGVGFCPITTAFAVWKNSENSEESPPACSSTGLLQTYRLRLCPAHEAFINSRTRTN